ncbi:MAG: tetratricopeptide repeat protein [Elusimicrobia bacterium]|nr:tetratricopeptide repeat protein [Elusimicrobiota bacterium]
MTAWIGNFAAAALFLGLLGMGSERLVFWPFPSLDKIEVPASEAALSLVSLSLGTRRIGADLLFIRMLQYYGTPEFLEEKEEGGRAGEHEHHDADFGGGVYAELYPRAQRILSMDPSFRYAVLYAATALAFNLGRPEEATALLRSALDKDPRYWRYHYHLAAIAYQESREFGKLAGILAKIVDEERETPSMLKNMLAALYVKLGRLEEARRVYEMIRDSSQDPDYVRLAEKKLLLLEQAVPSQPR